MSRKRTLSDLLRDTGLGESAGAHLARAVAKMGVRYPSVFTSTFVGPLPAGAAETVILTSPPLTLPLDGAVVFILYWFNIIPGTSTTFFTGNIRRGTTAGSPAVTTSPAITPTVAGTQASLSCIFFDSPGAVAGVQYSGTVSQIAATGAGTFQLGALLAFAL